MNTILFVLVGYFLAKFQYSDPLMFKLGIGFVLACTALEWLGEIILKVAFKVLSENK